MALTFIFTFGYPYHKYCRFAFIFVTNPMNGDKRSQEGWGVSPAPPSTLCDTPREDIAEGVNSSLCDLPSYLSSFLVVKSSNRQFGNVF